LFLRANQVSTENYYIIRADHNISDKDRLSGTFFRDKASTGTSDKYNNSSRRHATSETSRTIGGDAHFRHKLSILPRFGYNRITQGGPAGFHGSQPDCGGQDFRFFPQF